MIGMSEPSIQNRHSHSLKSDAKLSLAQIGQQDGLSGWLVQKQNASSRKLIVDWILFGGRIGIGVIFIYAGLSKILHPLLFLENLYDYDLLDEESLYVVGAILPCLELTIGVCLVGKIMCPGSLFLCVIMLVTFFATQISVVVRGISVSCACFGSNPEQLVGYATILRTGLLVVVALWLLLVILRSNNKLVHTEQERVQ